MGKVKYLITPSLLNSFLYYQQDERDNANEEFYKTLNKEFKMTEAIQKGIDFEDNVQLCCENKPYEKQFNERDEVIEEMSKILKGGMWQVVVKKDVVINDQPFLLYGRTDVMKQDYIFDVKTTASYTLGKYKNSMQHRLYMVCSNIKNFEYTIYDKKFYREYYNYNNNTENELFNCINDFMELINENEYFGTPFREKWICKY